MIDGKPSSQLLFAHSGPAAYGAGMILLVKAEHRRSRRYQGRASALKVSVVGNSEGPDIPSAELALARLRAGQRHHGIAAGAGPARGPDRGHERHPQPVRQPFRPQGAGMQCVCRVLLRSQMVRSQATWAYDCDCLMQGLDCGLAPCLAWPHYLPPFWPAIVSSPRVAIIASC